MPMSGSLYVHLPFCTRKCDYCHFYVLPDKEPLKEQLLESLILEWGRVKHLFKGPPKTIYFGGGTPALFGPHRIEKLMQLFGQAEEVTLEANPENITLSLMRAYRNAGINRISIGLQSLSDPLLILLSRTHDRKRAIRSVEETAEAGFSNISVDLMFDIPHQTMDEWKKTLREAAELPITHLSFYNLTFEPHTVFKKKELLLKPHLPDPETSLHMYEEGVYILAKMGFPQYEISAFAKPGYTSLHNTGYWKGRPFIGLGPSAFSFWEGRRFQNIPHLNRYTALLKEGKAPTDFEEKLSPEASYREHIAIHLRLCEGVTLSPSPFQDALTPILNELQEQGLLHITADHLALTPLGRLHYDSVASEIVL